MKAAALAILVIVALAALGVTAWGSSRGSDVAAEAAQAAEAQADRLDAALAEIEALQERTRELETELAGIEESSGRAGSQLDRVSGRLWGSLDKLRRSVADAKSANSSAASDAASALANAGAALRDLAILENRFEYHLRQHGGG
jgi:predicted  nucleic acid-binding Zn-ribbon protein